MPCPFRKKTRRVSVCFRYNRHLSPYSGRTLSDGQINVLNFCYLRAFVSSFIDDTGAAELLRRNVKEPAGRHRRRC